MKKTLTILLIFVFFPAFGQNYYSLVKNVKKILPFKQSLLEIKNIAIIDKSNVEKAIEAAVLNTEFKKLTYINIQYLKDQKDNDVALIEERIKQLSCSPTEMYGAYNYLKINSNNFKVGDWKNIDKSDSYNGAHHIINVSTLKVMYKESVLKYENNEITFFPFFDDIKLNAPAIFHPLHNHPSFTKTFHNKDRQIEIYNESGIEGIILDFFSNIEKLNFELGLNPTPPCVIKGTLLEAELWSKHFGFKWNTLNTTLK